LSQNRTDPETAPASRVAVRQRVLSLTVFTVGISTLGAEIAAARLLAPFFGASTIVWANTIGVVLVALSLGYWYGGKLGDRYPEVRRLSLTVLGGALLVTAIPFVAHPFFEVSIDALDQIEAGAFVGSLFAVLVLVAIPLAVLGTVSPWAVRLSVDDVEHAGAVAGRLYAISTAGSLLGTMVSALVLIPFAGTQRTFIAFGVMLALVASLGLERRFLLVPLLIAATLAIPVGTIKSSDEGDVIYEAESEHQYIRVIEKDDGERRLELNEGVATHSVYKPDSFLTGGEWDAFLVLPLAGLDKPPEKVAILGNAAGSTARGYGHYWPGVKVDGVEIDSELSQVGYDYFDMGSNPDLTVYSDDARPWLRRSEGGYDAIFVDAYRQPYLPFYLATKEFFQLAHDRMSPGGVLVVNAGHPEGNDELETALGGTMAAVFPHVVRVPIEDSNTMLVASDAELSPGRMRRESTGKPVEFSNLAALEASELGPRFDSDTVYTDDRAPVEWLIDKSILGYAEDN
jgi:spermidine synthase